MANKFIGTIKFTEEKKGRKGKVTYKTITENYIVDAFSYTEAEANLLKWLDTREKTQNCKVDTVKKARVQEIFYSKDGTDTYYFKATIGLVSLDTRSGKEKTKNYCVFIAASNFDNGLETLYEEMKKTSQDWKLKKFEETNILDIIDIK